MTRDEIIWLIFDAVFFFSWLKVVGLVFNNIDNIYSLIFRYVSGKFVIYFPAADLYFLFL